MGGPLSLGVAGANVHDTKLLALTFASMEVGHPDTGTQHVCLDKGYNYRKGG